MSDSRDLGNASMLELFRMEVESYAPILNDGLVALANGPVGAEILEGLMRAAHSIKGAARIVGLQQAVAVAHAMEDRFVSAQHGSLRLHADHVEVLLRGTDFLIRAGHNETTPDECERQASAIVKALQTIKPGGTSSVLKATASASMLPATAAPKAPPVRKLHPAEPPPPEPNYGDMSLLELFYSEVETHSAVLKDGFSRLDKNPADTSPLEDMLRAAHSLKGAARIVDVVPACHVAVSLEESFVAIIKGRGPISAAALGELKHGTELLLSIGKSVDAPDLATRFDRDIDSWKANLASSLSVPVVIQPDSVPEVRPAVLRHPEPASTPADSTPATRGQTARVEKSSEGTAVAGRAVRVNAASLSRLMGLAGEAMIEAGWLNRFEKSLRRLQDQQLELTTSLDRLRHHATGEVDHLAAHTSALSDIQRKSLECQEMLAERMHAFEAFALRSDNLSHRLYREVIASRMRPFADGIHMFPRMVHDVARTLGKKVRFEILGRTTQVDRDILEKLESPLNHLLRNAIDHGLESPEDRAARGKDEQGTIVLEAVHKGGMLFITVDDDGGGVDLERVRAKVVQRKMASPDMAAKMTEAEILEFLFLPGFSTAEKVTEISGRGVGLDVVRNMVQEVSGQLRVTSRPNAGCTFHVQLPITLSVLRALLVNICGEPYAFPLARIDRVLKMDREHIQTLENHQFFKLDGESIGLVPAQQILELDPVESASAEIAVVVIGEKHERYGLVVDRVLGEREVVVRPLDRRLGKVSNISAAALMENGSPLLIADVEDMIHSIRALLSGGRLQKVLPRNTSKREVQKRVLVVDDSLTVREVERKLLENKGYEVEVATDGAEGWNAVRTGRYDLVISDVDMPRMNGLEFVALIRADARYANLPVMIVSYKDREEDRLRGMEAGANYYLTKSSFHDESLLEAVVDLIGEAR